MGQNISTILRESGKWLLGFSPLLLALTFYALFRLFHGQLGLEAVTWIGSDHEAVSMAGRVTSAKGAVRTAETRLGGLLRDDKTILSAQTGLAEARSALQLVDAEAAKLPASGTATELSLRVCWGVACVMFSFLMVLVAIQSIREIDDVRRRSVPPPSDSPPSGASSARPWWLLGLPLLALVAWAGLTVWDDGRTVSKLGGAPATLLFDALEGTSDSPLAPKGVGLAKIPQLGWLLNFMNRGALVAILLVAGAVTAVVWRVHEQLRTISGPLDEPKLQKHARWLEVTMKRAATLMQLTAVTLIVGVIEVLLLYLLTSYHVRPTLQVDVRLVAQVLTLAGGLFYSGLLIAIYLPLYDAIRSLDTELAIRHKALASSGQGSQTGQAPAGGSLELMPIPVLKSLLTALLPVLTALGMAGITEAFQMLTNWL